MILKYLNLGYCIVWYNFQWFIKDKILRRPFTYTMRDFGLERPYIFWPICAGLFYLAYWIGGDVNYTGGFFFAGFLWLLTGHLWWGSPIRDGEQEEPAYLGMGFP
jgi:hypothetical protein